MGKKQDDIADRLNECLDTMVFDKLIDSFERQEMSRKLGILFELPDLLSYSDLREIAVSALLCMYSLSDEILERQQQEALPPPTEKLVFECTPRTKPRHANGADDVEGVNRS